MKCTQGLLHDKHVIFARWLPCMQVAMTHAIKDCQQTLGYKSSNMLYVTWRSELLDEAGIMRAATH